MNGERGAVLGAAQLGCLLLRALLKAAARPVMGPGSSKSWPWDKAETAHAWPQPIYCDGPSCVSNKQKPALGPAARCGSAGCCWHGTLSTTAQVSTAVWRLGSSDTPLSNASQPRQPCYGRVTPPRCPSLHPRSPPPPGRLPRRARVLELGCGPGLPGIAAAAALGADVTLTDLPGVLPLARANVEANCSLIKAGGGRVAVAPFDWREAARAAGPAGACVGQGEAARASRAPAAAAHEPIGPAPEGPWPAALLGPLAPRGGWDLCLAADAVFNTRQAAPFAAALAAACEAGGSGGGGSSDDVAAAAGGGDKRPSGEGAAGVRAAAIGPAVRRPLVLLAHKHRHQDTDRLLFDALADAGFKVSWVELGGRGGGRPEVAARYCGSGSCGGDGGEGAGAEGTHAVRCCVADGGPITGGGAPGAAPAAAGGACEQGVGGRGPRPPFSQARLQRLGLYELEHGPRQSMQPHH
jgi:hypothetical protein